MVSERSLLYTARSCAIMELWVTGVGEKPGVDIASKMNLNILLRNQNMSRKSKIKHSSGMQS